MIVTKKIPTPDLNIAVPRSSKDTLAGIAHLPRMIDKARAHRNNTLGEYIYPCPLDRQILKFLATTAEDFAELAETNDNAQIAEWADETGCFRSTEEKDLLNSQILDRKPDTATMAYFLEQRNQIDPARTDVVTWVDLNDLEEGHI